MDIAIGIDIGGTNTQLASVTEAGQIFLRKTLATSKHQDINLFINEIADFVKECQNANLSNKIVGIGIGAPNGNYYKGTIEEAPNLIWKGIIEFASLCQKKTGLKTILTNDANAAALGEKIFGDAKYLNDFLLVTLGTGLGSGFVANGQLIYGHDGFAGELGHTIVEKNGRLCNCGRRGCLERYVSATGLVLTAKEFIDAGVKSVLVNSAQLSAKDIAVAANKKDHVALKSFQKMAHTLGEKLADIVAITSPHTIFLFGGLATAGAFFLDEVKSSMEAALLPIFKDKVQIKLSGLNDSDAAILGAAALIWQKI